jgi:aldose 1-epimerase
LKVKIMKQLLLMGMGLFVAAGAANASVTSKPWGTIDGQPVQLFTLTGQNIKVDVTNFGARIVSVDAPDRDGKDADVVLGYKDLAGYEADKNTYLGSTPGRYANRIAGGTFKIDGHTYNIPLNNGANALHGGPIGFDRKVWSARQVANGVEFTLVSPDGDMGFPGKLTAKVTFTVTGNSLHIAYHATTDKATVLNLTNHTYFNLAGEGSGTILNEVMMINSTKYTPVDPGLIPTGKLEPVAGTPFDFTHPRVIGSRIEQDNEQLKRGGGYDHNYVLEGVAGTMRVAAKAVDPQSGRTLTVSTTEPGVQFYTGNSLKGETVGVSGHSYGKNDAFCLETQHFPDSPNHPQFPLTELKPGRTFHSETIFTFGVQAKKG